MVTISARLSPSLARRRRDARGRDPKDTENLPPELRKSFESRRVKRFWSHMLPFENKQLTEYVNELVRTNDGLKVVREDDTLAWLGQVLLFLLPVFLLILLLFVI